MYHARARQGYVAAAAGELGCELSVIKREAGRVLLMLEQKQDERLRAVESAETPSVTVSGDKVVADIGRDLWMSSQQDSNDFKSKQTSVAAGGSFTFGSMTGSGYISASQDKMKSTYDSVQEQTGLFAGNGGFDVTVGRHTQLDGAVIASTASADKNSLDTGTLGFSDLHNEADYKVSHTGISLSSSKPSGGDFSMGGMISAASNSGHAEGTTQAAVANGTITVRDKANQKQDVANLSRDTENANDSISPIFDKEKEQNRLKTVGLISDIGSQAADIAKTQGDIFALEAAKKEVPALKANATDKEREQYVKDLRSSPAYQKEMANFGTGSTIQRGIQSVTAALQGLAGGNIAGALAGASAPELANIIGHHMGIDDDPATKAVAHAILGGVVASLQGNNAASGAVGAASGELIAAAIKDAYYPGKPVSQLSEEEKQTISTLASISAGIAGGIAGGDTVSAANGAQAGKNSVENNFLGATSSDKLDKAIAKIKQGDKSPEAANDLIKLENADKRSDALMDQFRRDPSSLSDSEKIELNSYVRVYAAEMQSTHGVEKGQEMVKNLFAYRGYERNPDAEVLNQAQGIINTWGYHESNASIGNALLATLGGGVLGTTIKESMMTNAAIGTAVNVSAQLNGPDPFSYVDAIMAGATAAATTGQSWKASAAINMGGAAIGSAIKGEDPTNAVIGAGFGSLGGSLAGKGTSLTLKPVVNEATSEVSEAAISSIAAEAVGDKVKDYLDHEGKKQ